MLTDRFDGLHEKVFGSEDPHIIVHLNDEPTDYVTHWHTPMEILMPIDNTYTAHVQNETVELRPGDILFVAPNVYHSYDAPETGRRYFIIINVSVLSNILGVNQILSLISPMALFTPENAPEIYAELKQLFLDICDIYAQKGSLCTTVPAGEEEIAQPEQISFMETAVYGKLMEMLTLAARNYQRRGQSAFPPNRQLTYANKFAMICNYIDAHCTENLSLEDMSQMANFSKYHFARLFKEFTHETFYKYVNRKRIQHAEELLLHQKMTVTEIALESGYTNTSSFIRMFKLVKGCTPSEFKQNRIVEPFSASPPPARK